MMTKKKLSKKATQKENTLNVPQNTNPKECHQILEELNKEYAAKCRKKVNSLNNCCDCKIENESWPRINSRFDVTSLNTANDGAGGAIASGGGTDLQWEVGIGNATGHTSVTSWIPAFVYKNNAWVNGSVNSNWISYYQNGKHSSNVILYFRIRFYLNCTISPSDFVLNMNVFADNSVNDIYVNGISQAVHYSALLPQEQGSTSNSYNYRGFDAGKGINIPLSHDWKECENEIIVRVHSGPSYVGLLAGFTSPCIEAVLPEYEPSLAIKWGDHKSDCLEIDCCESLCLTVCNNYSNITFKEFKIGKLEICDGKGRPVPTLPNGEPSIDLVPKGPVCFGDIPPCSCISREFMIVNRGVESGKYKIKVSGVCYDVCLHFDKEACFELNVC